MATFSERYGYDIPRASLGQFESMDDRLQNALWSFLDTHYWRHASHPASFGPEMYSWAKDLTERIWVEQRGLAVDTVSGSWARNLASLRQWFFTGTWNHTYDLIEFILGAETDDEAAENLNEVLAREGAAYRLVASSITPITSAEEISAVEAAARPPGKFEAAGTHIVTAGKMLSDHDNPDYRNSIKESISAVEAVVRVLTGKPKISLGAELKTLGLDTLHPALKEAWSKMYGWTSDEGGIRHALSTDPDAGLAEARWMLVACSAFVNYLIAKSPAT